MSQQADGRRYIHVLVYHAILMPHQAGRRNDVNECHAICMPLQTGGRREMIKFRRIGIWNFGV